MAKIKVIWSNRAKKRLYEILEFSIRMSTSTTGASIIFKELKEKIRELKNGNDDGFETNCSGVKGLRTGKYLIFYEYDTNKIMIHTIQREISL